MAYTMFTLWIVGSIVSLVVLYVLLRVLYPMQESEGESTAGEP